MKEILWSSLDRASEWVKYAESKGLAILGVHAVTLGFFLNIVVSRHSDVQKNWGLMVSLIAALLVAFVSIAYSFKCLNPRLAPPTKSSPIYFRSVASSVTSADQFLQQFKERLGSDDAVEREVAAQVFANFVIASQKFEDVTWAMRFLVISLPLWTFVAFLLIF
jgi:hypothetical protein